MGKSDGVGERGQNNRTDDSHHAYRALVPAKTVAGELVTAGEAANQNHNEECEQQSNKSGYHSQPEARRQSERETGGERRFNKSDIQRESTRRTQTKAEGCYRSRGAFEIEKLRNAAPRQDHDE
jgi:hypothetical protein